MLSDTDKTLYDQLTEVCLQIEDSVKNGDFSKISELAAAHNTVMVQIKNIGQIEDAKMVPIIQKAEEGVKAVMEMIRQKQRNIMRQLTAEKNKKLLNKSYTL